MEQLGLFPFGQPVRPVVQVDRSSKLVFVLGVYASAVHACWTDNNGKKKVNALAVASEPCIFWTGNDAQSIISKIIIPKALGTLTAAAQQFNGPSGKALDDCILKPLGLSRLEAWLCDLVPYSCMNSKQKGAIEREYIPAMQKHTLPQPSVPELPKPLADRMRQQDILREIEESKAKYLILLGDQPIKWFLSIFDTLGRKRLFSFGDTEETYGNLHTMHIGDRIMQVLPVAHPRQVAKLGMSSIRWFELHNAWANNKALSLL